jgi:type IV pilus assembly protein PilB
MPRVKLGELLVQAGILDDLQLRAALGEQRKWGHPLGRTLIEMKLIDERTLVAALSRQLNVPAVDLEKVEIPKDVLEKLSYEFCFENACMPLRHTAKGNFLDVAMSDPTNFELFDRIRVVTRCNVRPHIVGPFALDAAIRRCYLGQSIADQTSAVQRRADEQMFELGGLRTLSTGELAATDFDSAQLGPAPSVPVSVTIAAPQPSAASNEEQAKLASEVGRASAEVERIAGELQRVVALLERDEKVIRKLMALLVEKGVCSKQELMARISKE